MNQINIFTFLTALILFQIGLSAQIVRGKIMDINSNEPLNNVVIMLVDSNNTVKMRQTTDSLGSFSILNLNEDEFNIRTYLQGYVSLFTGSYILTANDTLSLVIRLEAEHAPQVLKDEVPDRSSVINKIDLPDFYIAAELKKNLSVTDETKEKSDGSRYEKQEAPLPFLPRQIIEVVPKQIEGAKGTITLSINIDQNGYVKGYKIIKNTANKEECIEKVINAASKSRWQPIMMEGRKIDYWIEKSYEFN